MLLDPCENYGISGNEAERRMLSEEGNEDGDEDHFIWWRIVW
jgi:hypothetical protein